jgi:hypothetical protein
MTMKTKIMICLGALLCIAAVDVVKDQFELPIFKLTVKTIDEQRQPVSGVSIKFVFTNPTTGDLMPVTGLTGMDGLFSAEGGCNISGFGGNIEKQGYYPGGGAFPRPDPNKIDPVLNRWLPWNPIIEVLMRPIVNPVAMYARKIGIVIPEVGTPCGYDLMEADWLAPYGKGKTVDFLMTVTDLQYRSANDSDVTVVLSFPNEGDGIQEIQLPKEFAHSAFKWPREAPVSGYQPTIQVRRLWLNPIDNRSPGKTINTATAKETYFFRVRTVKRGNEIASAMYGKISAGIPVGPNDGKKAAIGFTYYLNPTLMDRNMEFDLTQNLFKNLKDEEKPRDP